ncbi:MAG: hypothetical protein HYY17_12885 [Planctomycetes bacterium]|nr:hypothetical protein [Planctomycetota bacterium]
MKHLALALSFMATAAPAFAQKVETKPERQDTLRIIITGELDLDGVLRSHNATAAGAGGDDHGSDVWTVEGDIRLRLDIEMQERIGAVLSLRTRRLTGGAGPVLAVDNAIAFRGADTNRLGANPEETLVLVDEASVTFNEFIDPQMRLAAGIVPVVFDLRGRGEAFFFDPRRSGGFGKNAGATVFGFADELQPAGVHLTYVRDAFGAGLFALPAIVEGGDPSGDESAYGFWFMFTPKLFAEGTRLGSFVAVDSFPGSETSVWTLGGGLDLHGIVDGLEIYAESYMQFGRAGRNAAGDVLSVGGWALLVGAEYRIPDNERAIWFGLGFSWITGDDDAADDKVGNFLSYENVNEMLVLEDRTYGLDLDTNYLSFKIKGGISFSVGSEAKNNLELSLLVGFNRLVEELSVGGGAASSNRIGHEVDLRAKLAATKQLAFETAVGILFGADVLEDVFGAEGNSAAVWMFGTRLQF